jgi:glucose-1-phosphate adenylyltransferase
MKIQAIILAGGEGSRLGTLTAKRTKPAVPFAGKYRIIDFPLSNCVNSDIYEVMILAQYRPHSLIEHIRAGGPWDLNREFSGGVHILTPYKARGPSDWYLGTADAVEQNFTFIKRSKPDLILILSGDHIYKMDYRKMIDFHIANHADLTMGTIRVPLEEAPRFGIVGVDQDMRIQSFVEKPSQPPSDLINMGVYLFNADILDRALLEDHHRSESSHDFGKDVLPWLIRIGARAFAFPYEDYWMDVGTVESYWSAHMDLLPNPPRLDLNDRSWIVHTRTEERPPIRVEQGAIIANSMICDGCTIGEGARVIQSILSPGVTIMPGAEIIESIILTDSYIAENAKILRAILDKNVTVDEGAIIGAIENIPPIRIPMVGKNSHVPAQTTIEPGAIIATDVTPEDFPGSLIPSDAYIETKRMPYEI